MFGDDKSTALESLLPLKFWFYPTWFVVASSLALIKHASSDLLFLFLPIPSAGLRYRETGGEREKEHDKGIEK